MLGFTDTTTEATISMEITSSTNDSPRLRTWNLSLSQITTSFPNEKLSSVNTDSVLTSKTPEEIGFVKTNEVALYSVSSTAEETVSSTYTDGVSKLNEGSHTILPNLPQYFTDDNLYVNNNSHEQFDLSTSTGKEILSTYQEKDTSNDTLNILKETYTPEYDIKFVTTEEPNLYENLSSSKLSSGMELSSTFEVTSVENTDLNETLSVGLTNSKEALEVLQSTLHPFTDIQVQAEFSQDLNYNSLISTQTFTDLSTSATVLEQTQSEHSITTSDFPTTLAQTEFETSNTSVISLTETETNDIIDLYKSTPITGQTGGLHGTDDQRGEGTWSYEGYTSDGTIYATFV